MFEREDDDFSRDDIASMVKQFEEALENNIQAFFDHSAFEYIIDYYEDQREYDRALAAVDAALSQYPFSSGLMTKQAQLLAEERRYDEAWEILDKAETLDPNELNIFLVRADICVWMGKHEEAVRQIQKALDITDESEHDDIYLELADVYEDWEKYLEVIDCMKKALYINPKNPEALNRIWFAYELTEDYEDSMKFHTEFIDIEPYSFIAWYNLAHACAGLGLYDKAKEAFDYAIAINERFDAAYTDCGDLLFNDGRFRDALEYYHEVLKFMQAPRKELLISMASCYSKLEEYKRARYYLRKCLNLDPGYADAYYRIAENYREEENWEKALTYFDRAVKLSPKDTDFMTGLADAYFNLGRADESIELYQQIVDLDPRDREHWINLAAALFDSEAYEESLEVLEKSEKLFGDNAYIFYVKAAFQYYLGHKSEALVNLQKGLLKNYGDHLLIFSINPDMEQDADVMEVIEQYGI